MVSTHPVKETSRRNELIESGKKRLYKSKSYFIRIELITHFAKLKDINIESVDSISRDERAYPLTQYITNGGISCARYTITHFKYAHHVLRLISNKMSVYKSP